MCVLCNVIVYHLANRRLAAGPEARTYNMLFKVCSRLLVCCKYVLCIVSVEHLASWRLAAGPEGSPTYNMLFKVLVL